MRNIAEIVKDDRNGKQLSQTERQVATAYIQGKYDAVMELKISNVSNTMGVLDYKQGYDKANDEWLERIDKIRAEIIELPTISINANDVYKADVLQIIDKYKAESEDRNEMSVSDKNNS